MKFNLLNPIIIMSILLLIIQSQVTSSDEDEQKENEEETTVKKEEDSGTQEEGQDDKANTEESPPSDMDSSMLVLLVTKYGACSGISITNEWILAPAHCLVKNNEKMYDTGVEVIGNYAAHEERYDSVGHRSTRVHVHDEYDSKTLHNDIAIVKIDDVEAVNKEIKPAKLQSEPWHDGSEPRSDCYATEFNYHIQSNEVRHLKKAYLVEARHGIDACPCIEEYDCLAKTVCVNGKRACNYCTGSLGGALICNGELVGISRQIVDCRQCNPEEPIEDCEQRYIYRTYTYVCPYRDWMKKYLNSSDLDKKVVCSGSGTCERCLKNSGSINRIKIVNVFTIFASIFLNILYNKTY